MNAPAPVLEETTALAGLLERQRAAFLREGPPDLDARRAALEKLRAALLERRAALAAAISEDFGHRPSHETALMELAPSLNLIDYLRRNLRRFMRPERRRVGIHFQSGSARVEYQPLGVVGILSPWNYPVFLTLTPLATALAAGNRAMLKPSEFTPRTSALLAETLAGAFSAEEVAVVQGDARTGAAFCALPFDHLFFTGSTAVGREAMRAASANLTPVTLELGGKSPVVVARGGDLARIAEDVVYGKLANAGQTCVAPDYALIPHGEVEAFAAACDAAVAKLYPAGPTSPDYAAIANDRHFRRLQEMLAEAGEKGARIRLLGSRAQEAASRPRTLAPALILDATDEMKILREEIFGPLLPVVPYRGIDEAIAWINARPRPLALYFFGPDDADRRKLLARTTSGGVTLNGVLMHVAQDDLPFGGVGASGMGASHGPEGFRAMSHARAVFSQHRWNGTRLLRPPFGETADRILGFLLR
ncbi:coniferyl aldehyde dehydrogenase [Neomegalonema sp.]|uniref:coniferyl aldehyde dehydrogenase n=1 Tax=Neomegalonema sp. TaxID=2039713 RepID=UPI00263658CD|nr:coniferyl aldehyde dehydrogenase [Neomegalonema sp.]MDD2868584.1 coniferyl aldehyde dehydrogenase [Neomegalonema sp.]